MDLLIDVNIILDLCTPRLKWYKKAKEAIDLCLKQGCCLWLYTGSVQTMEYCLRQTLHKRTQEENLDLTSRQIVQLARRILAEFSQDKNWLASLAGEGNVFSKDDTEDEQLFRALDRFPTEKIKLLTRNELLLNNYSDKTVSPENYCQLPVADRPFNFIDLKTQQDKIRPQLEKNINRVLNHSRYIMGPEVQEFESQLADYTGTKHCVGVSSGTDALLMPLMAQGIGPGDAVFTTPFTFIATAEVIQLLGATPVFVDIDPKTFNIDPKKLKLAIQAVQANDSLIHPIPHTVDQKPLSPKAIIPVDLFGLPADYDPIMELANQHNLFVLADSAQGFGGEYKGKKTGSFGHATTTSFFPAKPLGCYGDGGAIFTNNDDLADKLESIRVHGKGKDKYDNIRIGLNARLHTMQAAILLAKLQKFPQELEAKQKIAKKYTELLNLQTSTLSPPFIPKEMKSAWAQYSILAVTNEVREEIQTALKSKGIPSMVYYATPLHVQTAFAHLDYQLNDFPISLDVSKRIVSLPMHPYLNNQNLEEIVLVIAQALG